MVYQIIEDICRAYVATKPTKWKQYLPLLEFVYNNSKHTSIGCNYSMLMYFNHKPPSMLIFIEMN